MMVKKHILILLFFVLSNFCVTMGVFLTLGSNNTVDFDVSSSLKKERMQVKTNQIQCPITKQLMATDKVRLYFPEKNEIKTMNIEDYIIGVLTAEMYGDAPIEALKAMAVAARTYALYMCQLNKNKEYDVAADYNISQAYIDKDDAIAAWKDLGDEKYEIMKNAVELTEGEVLCYDGKMICALYHASSYPSTESCENIFIEDLPYLKGFEGVETVDTAYRSRLVYSIDKLNNMLSKHGYPVVSEDLIKITNVKNENGRCKYLFIKDKETAFAVNGRNVRSVFSLMSTSFDVKVNNESIVFEVFGHGHGVGLSQNGAVQLAKKGETYYKILSKYYSGTEIYKTIYK